ncbi:hypothetical protein HYALB_00012672 [Hymenoscyphus albidus]|uniref:Chromo domain-containing protein n=1 Tax=Hymenoscyphus albidus TaxID=595503 RepID=A0A9N9Q8S7_9HELO|nr:hypothetical protein HYALB_00012672 [Hymenoscyphus albidus]
MDNIVFYQTPSANSQPPLLPGARTSLNSSSASSTSFPVLQTTPHFNQQNDLPKHDMTKSRDVRHSLQKSHSDTSQMQGNLTATQNPLDSELLLVMKQKSNLSSTDPSCDDNNDNDDFPDIDELLSSMKQKSVPASARPNHGNTAEKVDNGTRRDSPLDSSCSTEGTTQDPIILSDDESTGAESETDYTNPDFDLTDNSYPNTSRITESEVADGDGFGSRAALTSHFLVADHQDDNIQLRLPADRPRSASPSYGSIAYQASKLIDTDNIQRSMNLDVTKELENKSSHVSTNGRELSAVSNTVSDSNIPKQSLQLDLAAASPQESDLKNDHLPKRRRWGVTENVRRKSPRTIAHIRLASTVAAALRSSAKPQSRAQSTTLDREMVDDGSADDSDDEYYNDGSDATGSQRGCRSRKRVRQTKDLGNKETSCGSMQESEEIPIHGSFALKIVESKVLYCLTFSQESSPLFQSQGQQQDSPTDPEEPQPAVSITDPSQEWGIHKITGQKIVRGERHFRVEWNETWMPESELAGFKEIVDTFITEVGTGTGGKKRPQKRSRLATGLPHARDEEEPKKRRGRSQKQT